LTSREQPEGLNNLTANGAVFLPLGGLMEGAIELLQHHRLIFDAEQWMTLVNLYGGNPLFLNMAANLIHELFAGNVGEFLASGTIVTDEFERHILDGFLLHIQYGIQQHRFEINIGLVDGHCLEFQLHRAVLDTHTLVDLVEKGDFEIQSRLTDAHIFAQPGDDGDGALVDGEKAGHHQQADKNKNYVGHTIFFTR
jgi:hypothetical protein